MCYNEDDYRKGDLSDERISIPFAFDDTGYSGLGADADARCVCGYDLSGGIRRIKLSYGAVGFAKFYGVVVRL